TLVALLADELAFWPVDETSANPDSEILGAARPSMATVPGSILLGASSPYARRGELFAAYERHFGKEDAPALVWHAPTRVMNETVPQRVIDEAYEADPGKAAAEYGAEFRTDVETFIDLDTVMAAVEPSVALRLRQFNRTYTLAVDMSGGRSDS